MNPQEFSSKAVGRAALLATALTAGIASQSAIAADITMTASNGVGASGLNSGAGWPGNVAPVAGNNYFTGAFVLRTPANGTSLAFAGDALSIDSGSRFILKNTGSTATITVANLILNGGNTEFAVSNGDALSVTLAGGITVNANSTLSALGAAANGSANFETLNVTAVIGGSAGLTISGTPNAGANTGLVRFSGNNTYSGTLTVATPTNGFVASATNRLLQLSNLNAVKNATLNLTSVANGVSFATGSNTGIFNVGALSGSSNQVLADTAGLPVKLSVGANNASTTYSGILSGPGLLTKTGTGILTLSGNNTYAGPTTVNAGTLSLGSAYLNDTVAVTIASGATLDLSHGATDVVGSLVIDGVPQADGVYGPIGSGAANPTAAITGTGFIQVVSPPPQNIFMNAGDLLGTTSFNTGLHWSNFAAPSAANDYFTGAFPLRSPSSAGAFNFGGASLSIDAGGVLLGKGAGTTTTQTLTINNLTLNGGVLYQANAPTDASVMNVLGAINVNAASTLGAIGATANGSVNFETLDIGATISGSAGLTVAGTVNGGANTGLVKLSAANPYSGNISVAQPGTGFIASATDRLLQMNHLDALANATLTLGTTAANGVSFAAGVNTGAFNVGALAGTAHQSLLDTTGAPIVLNVGGNGASTTYSGGLSGQGSLIKSGAGTLTLAGPNSHTGATSVNAGTLAFSDSAQFIGALTVANAAGISVKAASADSTLLSPADLTLGSATTLELDFNNLDTTAPLISTGAFTTGGAVNITVANGAFLTTGTHPVMFYTSFSGTAPIGSFSLNPRSTGTLLNNPANGVLNLNVTADKPKWTGAGNGNWAVGSTGATKNWRLVTANTATDYIEADNVLFDDSAPGTQAVVISAADVLPTSVTFDTADGYSLSGAFGIAGGTSLVKDGSGSLVIKTPNAYTGSTTINAGTLQLGDGVTDGSIASTSNIVNDGTLVYNRAGSFTESVVISGSGALVKSGPGSQKFTAVSSYFGTTTVTGGVLANGINNALGTTTELTVSGGSFDLAGFDQAVASLSDGGSNGGTVTNTGALKTLTLNGGGDTTFSGEISGPLSLVIQGFSKITLPDANSYTGTTRLTLGTVALGNEAALGTGLIDFAGGGIQSTDGTARTITNPINFNGANTNTTFGGTGNLTFTSTPTPNGTAKIFTVENPQTEFSGVLGGAGARTKEGNGLLIFSGLNTYSGATIVNAGVLRITRPVLADAAALEIGTNGVLDLTHGETDQVASLTINGVVKGNGVYDSSNASGFITGTGKIRVGAAVAGYTAWAAGFPFTSGVNDGAEQDADGDGIKNVLEYVLGGIPVGAGSSDFSILPTPTLGATDVILSFKRSDLSEADTVLKAQWSTDLAAWNDFATIGAGDALPAVDVTEDSPSAALDTVVVTIPRSNAVNGNLYVRLLATKP